MLVYLYTVSTVRLGPAGKRHLRRLQDAWERAIGTRPTQEQLLEAALGHLDKDPSRFLGDAAWTPLTKAEIRRLERRVVTDWGPGAGAADVDEVVYGRL
ncbi:MAG TPA: hypothetical protein VI997_02640 [Candidatus Thermoplasmatota archaeon]|nr:hypothetical protein [Candidatus Thermoplasmatota archaeon]